MPSKPRRKKFSPLQMSERFKKATLAGLCVFLIIIFFVPISGPCRRERGGEGDRDTVLAVVDGSRVTRGEVADMRRTFARVFRPPEPPDEADMLLRIAELHEAQRVGIRVSDEEVDETIRSQVFPQRARVEYAIADLGFFEKKKEAEVGPPDIDAYYRTHKEQYKLPDKTYRPIGEVREQIAKLARLAKARSLARKSLVEFKHRIQMVIGPEVETEFHRLAPGHGLLPGATNLFTPETAYVQLRDLRDAPKIVKRVFSQPIGEISEPLELPGALAVFRVILRYRGFDPEGNYCPNDEGWVRQGYGVISAKSYDELVRELSVTGEQLEETVREHMAVLPIPGLLVSSAAELPESTVRERCLRDGTRAVAAYFGLRTADFAEGIPCSEEELRTFYDQHKNVQRTEDRVGYLQPQRVSIEYILGRKDEIEKSLNPRDVTKDYEKYRQEFKGAPEQALFEIRGKLANRKLREYIDDLVRATRQGKSDASPDLAAVLASEAARLPSGAFECKKTPLFSAQDVDHAVPDLVGGKLAEILFGEKAELYAVAGTTPKPGTHFVSEDLPCDAGRFFFRVLQRVPATEVPYGAISPEIRQQLLSDVMHDKAFKRARDKATEYRSKIGEAAFDRFAALVHAKAAEADLLAPDSPLPALGKAVPALYDQLALAAAGDLSDVASAGDKFALARLASREEGKGLHVQFITFGPDDFKGPYDPATYELQARYGADPFAYLDPPKPMPLKEVEGAIRKLLAHRRALAVSAERLAAATAELAGAKAPDLAAIAAKHNLTLQRGVKVDLGDTEATPQIGKALGFHDAVTALKPGEPSRVLSSAEGRFVFVPRARDEKAATVDVLAGLYAPIAAETPIEPKEIEQYYEANRSTAYMTNDEIKPAPAWKDVPKTAVERVGKAVQDEWAQKPPAARLSQLRDSLVEEAFRTVPEQSPLARTRQVKLAVLSLGPFLLSKPPELLDREPALLKAVSALKAGEVSAPVAIRDGAAIAFLADRKADDALAVELVAIAREEVSAGGERPSDDELKAFYDANPERFRIPDALRVHYLAAFYPELMKNLTATDDELLKEYQRAVAAKDTRYRDWKNPTVSFLPFEQARNDVRRNLLLEKAQAEAVKLLAKAKEALAAQGAAADFKAIAEKFPPLHEGVSPFFKRDEKYFGPLGRVPDLAAKSFGAKDGEVLGPFLGSEGACLARRQEFKAAHVPPFEAILPRVLDELMLAGGEQRALEAAGKLRDRAAAALEKAPDKRAAFRKAIEDEPLAVPLTVPVRVTLSAPFFPNDAGPGRSNAITGLGVKADLTRAIFRLRPAQLTPVVDDPDQMACYVALLTQSIPAPDPTERELLATRVNLAKATQRVMQVSWRLYLQERIAAPR